jgi:hypothetical protein
MIDYFSHVSALRVCLQALKTSPPTDPAHKKAVPEALDAAAAQPGAAILGTLVDHLLQYSQSATSVEIGILTKAAALFADGLSILNKFAAIRPGLETGVTTPNAPGALAAYNAALAELPGLQTDLQNIYTKLEAFQATFSVNWIAPVGQQQGTPVLQWDWRDVFLARRTTAFVASTQKLAATSRQLAFAVGTLAGAAGNIIGSGYLNAVVGGPRRSHTLRHRLAAYSVGAWLRDNEHALASTLADIRQALTFGETGTLTLPSDLKTLAHDALEKAYPTGTQPLPDLETGYTNLMEHLKLLGEFTLPPVPAPMSNALTSKMIQAGVSPGVIDLVGGAVSGIGTNYPQIGSHENAGGVCLTLLSWLFFPPSLVIAIDDALGGGEGPDPSVGVSSSGLTAIGSSVSGLSAVNSLYGLATSFWQALAAARTALVLRGLLYPNPDDLSSPTFAQFVSIPGILTRGYPLLSMPATDDGTAWPTSAIETPVQIPAPFAVSSAPSVFLTGATDSVSATSSKLWEDMIEFPGRDLPGSANLNLDADRGFAAHCWALDAGSTITTPPVLTTALPYTGI